MGPFCGVMEKEDGVDVSSIVDAAIRLGLSRDRVIDLAIGEGISEGEANDVVDGISASVRKRWRRGPR